MPSKELPGSSGGLPTEFEQFTIQIPGFGPFTGTVEAIQDKYNAWVTTEKAKKAAGDPGATTEEEDAFLRALEEILGTTKDDSAETLAAFMLKLREWGVDATDPDVKDILKQLSKGEIGPNQAELLLQDTRAYQTATKSQGESNLAGNKALLRQWNIPMDDELQNILKLADEKGWSDYQTKAKLAKTKAYQMRFGGKLRSQTEEEYISREDEYHNIAEQLGINMGEGPNGPGDSPRPSQGWRVKYLMKNDVSPAEFRQKGEAMAFIRDNDELFKQFGIELANAGLLGRLSNGSPKPLSQEHLLAFVFGQGEAQWHETWQNTIADYAAVEAGIKIAKGTGLYTGLSRSEIHKVADKNLTQEQLQAGFDKVSEEMVGTLPLSQARGYGLTKDDLTQAAFGGPNAAQARAKIARVKKEHEAFGEDRATLDTDNFTQSPATGLTARKGYAQSDG